MNFPASPSRKTGREAAAKRIVEWIGAFVKQCRKNGEGVQGAARCLGVTRQHLYYFVSDQTRDVAWRTFVRGGQSKILKGVRNSGFADEQTIHDLALLAPAIDESGAERIADEREPGGRLVLMVLAALLRYACALDRLGWLKAKFGLDVVGSAEHPPIWGALVARFHEIASASNYGDFDAGNLIAFLRHQVEGILVRQQVAHILVRDVLPIIPGRAPPQNWLWRGHDTSRASRPKDSDDTIVRLCAAEMAHLFLHDVISLNPSSPTYETLSSIVVAHAERKTPLPTSAFLLARRMADARRKHLIDLSLLIGSLATSAMESRRRVLLPRSYISGSIAAEYEIWRNSGTHFNFPLVDHRQVQVPKPDGTGFENRWVPNDYFTENPVNEAAWIRQFRIDHAAWCRSEVRRERLRTKRKYAPTPPY
ncbi:MAG: hypothetical protein HYV18_01590 [Gammaproteobacteria bacterium]|nr:hypothetical protein [Gammaproteobacteria bacterium]